MLPTSLRGSEFICNIKGEIDIHYRKQAKQKNTIRINAAKELKNIFLKHDDGELKDMTSEQGLALSGWSWNAKFADFDADGWQDLYVVNGFFPRKVRESNYYFRNERGQKFVDATPESGLEDYLSTGSSINTDFDNDGDLDILISPFFGPMRYFENNTVANQSISFELFDELGNLDGANSKIIIYYDGSTRKQVRELKLGGGYQSFDPLVASFGVGNAQTVDSVLVQWSTGEQTKIDGPLETGSKYRVYRTVQ